MPKISQNRFSFILPIYYTVNQTKMYLFHFILGGLLHCLLHYFATTKQSKICALIPALPILGVVGLIHLSNESSKEINIYLKSTMIFFTIYVLLFSLIYFLYGKTKSLVYSGAVSFVLWIIVVASLVCN